MMSMRLRDLSTIEGIDALLARYQRAGEVLAAARKFRKQTRRKIIDALGDADTGKTSRWLLRLERRLQSSYTVADHYRNYLLLAPLEDGEADDGSAG